MFARGATLNSTTSIVYGWVSSPDGRGTGDILQSCLATVLLCTYSVLFLNIKQHRGRIPAIAYKTKWVVFTIFFPESITTMAAEQWRSAQQSVADYAKYCEDVEKGQHPRKVGKPAETISWTTRHAHWADMGGFHLKCPDYQAFPIDSTHLLWLVRNGFIELPHLDEKTIKDRNKADSMTRALTLLQVAWFTIQVLARVFQHLSITTLEISTLAFACCTLHAFWFWKDKPLDVAEPIVIECDNQLRSILHYAAPAAASLRQFTTTPLDFLDQTSRLSYVDPFFYGLQVAFGLDNRARSTPVSSFSNERVSHRNMRSTDVLYGYIFGCLYFGIHMAAWSFQFPTRTELLLWRISAITLSCIGALYVLGNWPGNYIHRRFFVGHPEYATDMLRGLPRPIVLLLMWAAMILYVSARTYIIVEGFVSLRALPASAYATVKWQGFEP